MKSIGKRRSNRKKINKDVRVYTSIKSGAYFVKMENLGEGGAYLKSKYPPKVGEVISYDVVDWYYNILFSGNAKVVWSNDGVPLEQRGFGISFIEKVDRLLINKLI